MRFNRTKPLTEAASDPQSTWSPSAPLLCQSFTQLGSTDSHPALDNFECVDDAWAAHCLTTCPMSSCFIATSSSCSVSNQTMFTQIQFNINMSELESCERLSFSCGTTFYLPKTQTIYNCFWAKPMSRRSLFDVLSIIWLWSEPVFSFVLHIAWAALEQCKLLSVCGVSF